ncbi:MAG: BLUF domain-containing protein [Paracraurococcus sp.]|jgi:hypothetical protein
MTGDGGVFRLVYASRSLLTEQEVAAEIPRILDTARRNNAGEGITGALLCSADAFVQVLEGPMAAVERTFERIQCDPRHAEVVVLEAAPAAARDFAGWAMAFAGRRAGPRFGTLEAAALGASPAMLELLRGALERMAGVRTPT